MNDKPSPHALSIALGLILTGAAIAVLLVQNKQWRDVSDARDWERAANALKTLASHDDAFRIEPPWDNRPRVFLQDHHFIPAQDSTWFDTEPFKRIWILTEARRKSLALERLPAEWTPTREEAFGDIILLETSRVEPDNTLWDLFSALPQAKVSRTRGTKVSVCKPFLKAPSPRWRCQPGDQLSFVGEATKLMSNDVHRCLWAMPTDKGGALSIAFEEVPLGRKISGHYGLTLDAIRSFRGAPVSFSVLLNGDLVHSRTFGLHEEGFPEFTVDTSAHRGPDKTGRLTFEIKSDDHLDRQFCFTARVIR